MARRLKRKNGKLQVVSDVLLARRMVIPCSLDVPVSKRIKNGEPTYPLYRSLKKPSVFDGVEQMRLVGSKAGRGSPKIVLVDHKLFTVRGEGRDYPSKGRDSTTAFSFTTKMTAPSFSLPAGPVKEGGTCAAANVGAGGGKRIEGKQYICDECYSLEGNYIFADAGISQAIRYHWVIRMLNADPSGLELGRQLAVAIEDYARHGTVGNSDGGTAARLTSEIGVWDGGQIVVQLYLRDIKRSIAYPCAVTDLPSETGFRNTRELFASRKLAAGDVCGFFRIHDSGDFTIGAAKLWPNYVAAWAHCASLLPNVLFWAPTRAWIFPAMLRKLVSVAEQTPNLIIRPSGLHESEPAPTLEGLANGTTVAVKVATGIVVHKGRKKETYEQEDTFDASGRQTWRCPTYRAVGSGPSCMGMGCRACWVSGAWPIAYGKH